MRALDRVHTAAGQIEAALDVLKEQRADLGSVTRAWVTNAAACSPAPTGQGWRANLHEGRTGWLTPDWEPGGRLGSLNVPATLRSSLGDLARQGLSPRCHVRRQRHQLRPVQRGRRARGAVPVRRRRPRQDHRDARRADRGRRLRLARLPAVGAAGPALRLPRARAVGPEQGQRCNPASCCSTPTPRRPPARSTGTSRCSATPSATRTRATTTTPRRT